MPLPMFRIDQEVHIPLCKDKATIKGLKFVSLYDETEWEYKCFHWYEDREEWGEWGWVTESEIKNLNS